MCLEVVLELSQVGLPEAPIGLEPAVGSGQALRLERVELIAPNLPTCHESSTLQNAEVLGDGWSAKRGALGDNASGVLPGAEKSDDRSASRISESVEHSVQLI